MEYQLEFEKPINELENQIKELQEANSKNDIDISKEIKALQMKVNSLVKEVYANLSPWERVQLSRHPQRPHTIYYINQLIDDFHEVYGDRKSSNDLAMVSGFGYFKKQKVAVIGIEKGEKTKDKVQRNFGMPSPDGYRKALRVMEMASRFDIPVITFVDTPGAYPGKSAEERGQAEAIAYNLTEIFSLKTPIISFIIGEGGSGGALGIAIADSVYMLEYSVYSVISPESCASILWSDPGKAQTAANALNLGPSKAQELEIIDGIVKEPTGGAHRDPEYVANEIAKTISSELQRLKSFSKEELLSLRYEKFREMGNKTIKNF